MRHLWLVVVVGMVACSSDEKASSSDAAVDSAVDQSGDQSRDVVEDGTQEQGVDQGPTTGQLVVKVLSLKGYWMDGVFNPGEQPAAALPGATVAADLPGSGRQELATGADGSVTFEEVHWAEGPATITAYAKGHTLFTIVGVTADDGEQTIQLLEHDPPATVMVSGSVKNLDPEANYFGVAPSIYGTRSERDPTFLGPSFSVRVQSGVDFALYAAQAKLEPVTTRDYSGPVLSWNRIEHAAITEDTSMDIDFEADVLTPKTANGTMTLPSTGLVGTASRPWCWVMQKGMPFLYGLCTKSTQQGGGSDFTYEVEYLEPISSEGSSDGIVTLYFAEVGGNFTGSIVEVDGYPQPGATISGFIEVPVLVEPGVGSPPIQRNDVIVWKNNEPTAIPIIGIGSPELGAPVWSIQGFNGMTELHLPELPSTVDPTEAFGESTLNARIWLCEDGEPSLARCSKMATSQVFQILPDYPKTVTVHGQFYEFMAWTTKVPDVEVCIKDMAAIPCVKTNAQGQFSIPDVPNDQDLIITATKSGYFPWELPRGRHQAVNKYNFHLVPESGKAELEAGFGEPLDPAAGMLVVSTMAGTTVKLEPVAGAGPVHAGEGGWPDPDWKPGEKGPPWIWFGNVPVGDYEVTVTSPGKICQVSHGWKTASGKLRVKISADTLQGPVVACK